MLFNEAGGLFIKKIVKKQKKRLKIVINYHKLDLHKKENRLTF